MEAIENGASNLSSDLSTDTLILMGYPEDVVYRKTTEQGEIAYLRAVELMAQKRGVEMPIIDPVTLDAFDNDLLGLDRNMEELLRQKKISAQKLKEVTDITDNSTPGAGRSEISFVDNKRFFLDGEIMKQRWPALNRGLEAIKDREPHFVAAYRKSTLYVDKKHEKAFLVPVSILHGMFRVQEELAKLRRSFDQ